MKPVKSVRTERAAAAAAPVRRLPWTEIALFTALLLATLLCYLPALRGGVLWDDAAHITPPAMRTFAGLLRIWFVLGATQQYYPLVHSTFWLESMLWGDRLLLYHLVNVLLHATSAYLVVRLMRRLRIGGAVLAGAIFAAHPVQVESVAWITELKNTMSGVFCLAAALAYLRFRGDNRGATYRLALGLFVLALLSKTVTATLPAALLAIFWWQQGRLDARRDVVPLLPFFALGLAGGALTAWVERTYIGASGSEYGFSLVERTLIAGRAIAFYLGKLVWPANVMFLYPRWTIDAGAWRQYLFPAGVALALGAGWLMRRWSRAPLAALLAFCLMLAPALGFVNVYPFRYSFVADHFQYHASIAAIAFAAGSIAWALTRWAPGRARVLEAAAIVVLAAPMVVLAHADSRKYADAATLYRDTLARNPGCWLCHENLGVLALDRGPAGFATAIAELETAIAIYPDDAQMHNNLGTTYFQVGRYEDALREHDRSLQLAPWYAEAHGNRGADLQKLGRAAEAAAEYREALRRKPSLTAMKFNLAIVLIENLDGAEEAARLLREVLQVDPAYPDAHKALADALIRLGRTEDAQAELRQAAPARGTTPIAISATSPDASRHVELGTTMANAGRFAEAAEEFQAALRADPAAPGARGKLGFALWRAGRLPEAAAALRAAIAADAGDAAAHDNLGNVLQSMGQIREALVEYDAALALNPASGRAEMLNDRGVALARLGRMSEAAASFGEAVRLKPDFAQARENLARASR